MNARIIVLFVSLALILCSATAKYAEQAVKTEEDLRTKEAEVLGEAHKEFDSLDANDAENAEARRSEIAEDMEAKAAAEELSMDDLKERRAELSSDIIKLLRRMNEIRHRLANDVDSED